MTMAHLGSYRYECLTRPARLALRNVVYIHQFINNYQTAIVAVVVKEIFACKFSNRPTIIHHQQTDMNMCGIANFPTGYCTCSKSFRYVLYFVYFIQQVYGISYMDSTYYCITQYMYNVHIVYFSNEIFRFFVIQIKIAKPRISVCFYSKLKTEQ